MADLLPIEGVVRDYAWGSHTYLQHLLGRAVDGRPAAELWFGDHPGAPSPAGDTTLDRLVHADPDGTLGAADAEQLPFLLKVLAAAQPLSIQVHPTIAQARAGYDAEERAGIPRDAPDRNYVDRNHKPELLCALEPFEALCGFRPVEQTLDLLGGLAIRELGFLGDLLRGPDPLRAAFTALLRHDDPASLAAAVAAVATADGPLRPSYLAARHFPGDIGVVLALLLNHVVVEPGQAIYLGAGNVHAYLVGAGVEIMASSDNVLRCALTNKHVDIAELLAVADFRELPDPLLVPETADAASVTYPVPVPDFRLSRTEVSGRVPSPEHAGPRIVLCTEGEVEVEGSGGRVRIRPGHAVFAPADLGPLSLSGSGVTFTAGTALAKRRR